MQKPLLKSTEVAECNIYRNKEMSTLKHAKSYLLYLSLSFRQDTR